MVDDTQAVIAYVREKYNPPFFFLAGFSFGAYLAVGYAVEDGGVDGVVGISHTCDPSAANRCLAKPIQRRVYLNFMMQKIKALLKKNKELAEEHPEAFQAKSLDEFDNRVICPEVGMSDAEAYYAHGKLKKTLPQVKTVTLVLAADNDPMIDFSCTPREEAETCENGAYVHVKNGGHVSFPVVWGAKTSLIDEVVLDFCQTIIALKS
jgi:predicted alpha/beta-fold hydrolase